MVIPAAETAVTMDDNAPSPDFPVHCLPPDAQVMAESICKAVGVPASLAGPCVLGVLSASIGAGLEIQSGATRTSRANLYILVSAESGSGKSEVIRHAATPFWDFERERLDHWNTAILPGLRAELEVLKEEINHLKKEVSKADGGEQREEIRRQLQIKLAAQATTEAAMRQPVLCVENVTTEKLALMLAQPGETLFSVSADAGEIVNNLLGRYAKGDRTDEGIYLKSWTGEHVKVDRLGRDSILLERPCITALWCVQPDKVESLLGVQSLSDGGLMPRILPCHTGCEMREITGDAERSIPAEDTASWRTHVRELLESFRLSAAPATIVQPEPEALRQLNDHYNGIVRRCRTGDLRDVQSFAARWTEQAWRIALCLHAGLYSKDAGTAALHAETANSAIAIADWFRDQQLAILQKSRSEKQFARLQKLRGLIVDYGGGPTLRDLAKNNGFNAEEVRRLAANFPAQILIQKRETGGRPSEIVYIPGALTGAGV